LELDITTAPSQSKQIRLAPFKFPFCVFALGNVSINEVDGGYLVEAKRNALSDNGNVKANTAFALSNGLQFDSLPRSAPPYATPAAGGSGRAGINEHNGFAKVEFRPERLESGTPRYFSGVFTAAKMFDPADWMRFLCSTTRAPTLPPFSVTGHG
jgi:hypothetical protein